MTYDEKIKKVKTARNILQKLEGSGILENNLSAEQITAIRIAEYALDELWKSKEGQPVKRGRWIDCTFYDPYEKSYDQNFEFKCSYCGHIINNKPNDDNWYCGHCGARMYGDTNG